MRGFLSLLFTSPRDTALVVLLLLSLSLHLFTLPLLLPPAPSNIPGEAGLTTRGTEWGVEKSGKIPRLSGERGPTIGETGAMIVVDEAAIPSKSAQCVTLLGAGTGILLLAIYLTLLIFNLIANGGLTALSRPRWIFESLLTLFFLLSWPFWDTCRTFVWFPLSVLEVGTLVYAFYLFFLGRRAAAPSTDFDEYELHGIPPQDDDYRL